MKKLIPAVAMALGISVPGFGLEPLPFDGTQWRPVNLKFPGSETIRVENVPLETTGRQVPAVIWGIPRPPVIELTLRSRPPKFESFERAEFILTVQAPEKLPLRRIVLRLTDRTGETFQFAPVEAVALKPGKNAIHYAVDAASPKASIWGGNGDRKIDWPLRLTGIAIDTNAKTPADQRILLDSLECRPAGEHAEISLNTGHPLKLLLPGRTTAPELVIRNSGMDELKLTGTLTLTDTTGVPREEQVSCNVQPGSETGLALPGDDSRQGWWKVDYRLKSASGREFSGTHRFARMRPIAAREREAGER